MIGALAKALEQALAISGSHFLDASGTTLPATGRNDVVVPCGSGA